MTIVNVTNARKNLYKIIESLHKLYEPVLITSKKGNAVLVSEDDWEDIQETLYLNQIPGMKESILKGKVEKLDDCSEVLDW